MLFQVGLEVRKNIFVFVYH